MDVLSLLLRTLYTLGQLRVCTKAFFISCDTLHCAELNAGPSLAFPSSEQAYQLRSIFLSSLASSPSLFSGVAGVLLFGLCVLCCAVLCCAVLCRVCRSCRCVVALVSSFRSFAQSTARTRNESTASRQPARFVRSVGGVVFVFCFCG